MNHYPLIGRTPARECRPLGGSVDPFAPVTCPSCRARLQAKADAERSSAAEYKPSRQEYRFHLANAAQWDRTLAA